MGKQQCDTITPNDRDLAAVKIIQVRSSAEDEEQQGLIRVYVEPTSLWCRSRLAFNVQRLLDEVQDGKEFYTVFLVHQSTNSSASAAVTAVFHKPVASHHVTVWFISADSLHPARSHQWGQVPLEAACDCIML